MESLMHYENQRQLISIPVLLLSLGLDSLKKSTNQPNIELATNFDYNKNMTSLLEALVKDTCNAKEDIIPAGKKRT